MNSPELLPPPKDIHLWEGIVPSRQDPLRLHDATLPPQGYRLTLDAAGITIEHADDAGAFYARQTLDQLYRQYPESLPALVIEDAPDYPVRGFYHDVTRGKVPTLATLKRIADVCASWKMNQLQLYIEHTFAYQAFPEVWQDADPLTADEIRDLDAHCRALHIELVPSFSTFGRPVRVYGTVTIPKPRAKVNDYFEFTSLDCRIIDLDLKGLFSVGFRILSGFANGTCIRYRRTPCPSHVLNFHKIDWSWT